MPLQGAEPGNRRYAGWDKNRRFAKAVQFVVNEGWTIQGAAREVGVSRPRLSEHVKVYREELAAKVEQAKQDQLTTAVLRSAAGPQALQEKRRVGTFWEFSDRFWGRWDCPDCKKHHEDPYFHRAIVDEVLEDPAVKRGVVNLPPYHAKSTLITVKHTVYKVVQDPNWRRIILSQNKDFAGEFLYSIQQLLTNPSLYQDGPNLIEEWGPFKDESAPWSTSRFYVSGRASKEKDPTVQVIGWGGQIFGKRADDIVMDDIATLDNQVNPMSVQKMLRKLDQEIINRVGKSGACYFVGTRVAAGDIYSVLHKRSGYKVLRYPCIVDDATEETLWGDHFPYSAAIVMRAEMGSIRDWQLVYQNVDAPGEGAAFTQESIDKCKDTQRVSEHFENRWRLVAGVDLAGGTKTSGYSAGVLLGVDLATGKRFLIDCFNQKGMRSPVLKDKMLDWAARYPIYSYRVESNSLQSQIIQYDTELVKRLGLQGTRVEPHKTQGNKWDPQFGVESMAPFFDMELYSIPWANSQSQRNWQTLVDQLILFPMGAQSDLVMALWFADIGARDLLRRMHLPRYDKDSTARWPNRIKRQRKIIDFHSQTVTPVPKWEQDFEGAMSEVGTSGYRRLIVDNPKLHGDVVEKELPTRQELVIDRHWSNTSNRTSNDGTPTR